MEASTMGQSGPFRRKVKDVIAKRLVSPAPAAFHVPSQTFSYQKNQYRDSSLEGALASICDTPLLSEGVTEAPEEKLPSGELQLSPPLPQVLGRQPLSPRGPASSQEQGLAGFYNRKLLLSL
ncbi:Zinc Finger Protein 24 [Manis pentadactyla]|nr:Zinc Finger Protein 24 [Manis pentadactyla]